MKEPRAITPPEYAKRLGVKVDRIRAWIRSGELGAVDVSSKPGTGRPRFRIRPSDIVAFESGREVKTLPRPRARRSRRRTVKKYF